MRHRLAFLASLTFIASLHAQTTANFFQPTQVALNCTASLMAQGDFNGDGLTDLAIPCGTLNSFLVLLADGKGFSTPVTYATNSPIAIAAGDLNGDGIPDLAVLSPGSISIYTGKGDGTFPDSRTMGLTGGFSATYIAIADVNGDGKLDLIVGASARDKSGLLVFPGNGNGSFQPPKVSGLIFPPTFFMTGDFNGDGKTDLALVEYFSGYGYLPSILASFGNGDGTFQPEIQLIGGGYSNGIGTGLLVTGDFNHDGRTDIAGIMINQLLLPYTSSLEVKLGQADGTFTDVPSSRVQLNAQGVAARDLNGDGILDLAVANEGSGTVTVLIGNGDGSFTPKASYPAAAAPYSIAIGNFFVAGRLGLAVDSILGLGDNYGQAAVDLLPVESDGALAAPPIRAMPRVVDYPQLPADYNRDGNLDLVSTNRTAILFSAGNGDGSFQPAKLAATGSDEITLSAVADFNNDGIPDLFTFDTASSQHTGSVYLGNGDGTFHLPQNGSPFPVFNDNELIGDVNDDGIPDVLINAGGVITVYLGKGDGTFQSGIVIPYSLGLDVLGDFNNDGNLDLIAMGDTAFLLLGNGDGTFQPPVPTSPNGAQFAVDLSGDGNLDLIAYVEPALNESDVSIALGNGDGTFQAPQLYTTPFGYVDGFIYIADFNGDGNPDFAVSYDYLTYLFINLGDLGAGYFNLQGPPLVLGPHNIRNVADFYNHGLPDIQTTFGSPGNTLILKNLTTQ